jgi:sugar phosphate isomerase/epimerase
MPKEGETMKIGVRAHDFGRKDAAELAREIRGAGFECVQLALTKAIAGIENFKDITQRQVEQVREAFSREDVELTVYGCYVEPALADKAARLVQVGYFCEGVRFARLMGASVIATETTRFPLDGAQSEREEAYQRLKDSALRMAEAAEKEGMTIGIEPVAVHTLNTPELARRLQEEVGSSKLKIVFDPVNMLTPDNSADQRGIFAGFLKILGDDIAAMHIKDVAVVDNDLAWRNIGEGSVDYQPIMAWLKQHKPDMRLLREHVKMDSYGKDVEALRRMSASA